MTCRHAFPAHPQPIRVLGFLRSSLTEHLQKELKTQTRTHTHTDKYTDELTNKRTNTQTSNERPSTLNKQAQEHILVKQQQYGVPLNDSGIERSSYKELFCSGTQNPKHGSDERPPRRCLIWWDPGANQSHGIAM